MTSKQKKYLSQNDEERVIVEYFGNSIGLFLDIGANDGVTLSNTRRLALNGWGGTLIEGSTRAFERLKNLYRDRHDIQTIKAIIESYDGEIVFYESGSLLSGDDISLVSTTNEKDRKRFENRTQYEKVIYSCNKWQTIEEQLKYKNFDFISIDIEGSEMKVLPFIDTSQTNMVCIEWNGDKGLRSEYSDILNGFKIIHTTPENLIFAR